jgi:hypothetical protein
MLDSLKNIKQSIILKRKICQALVAHTCHPSYSGGRDQEDHSSKSALANSSRDPISKIPNTKRAGRELKI